MKSRYIIGALAAILALGTPNTMAQETAEMKEFTLEDLNFGGTNYRNMIPQNRRLTWWGDLLVRLDAKECYLVDKKTGKETVLFTVDEVNEWMGVSSDKGLRSLSGVSFPYADQSAVLVKFGGERRLVDFEQKKQVWHQSSANERQASSFNTTSRHTAYVDGDQLYFRPADGGKDIQPTIDLMNALIQRYKETSENPRFIVKTGLAEESVECDYSSVDDHKRQYDKYLVGHN